MKKCFLNQDRICAQDCAAYSLGTKEPCRIIGSLERMIPIQARPIQPAPKVTK